MGSRGVPAQVECNNTARHVQVRALVMLCYGAPSTHPPAQSALVVVDFMVSAQWEEALSPLSSNPALFEDIIIIMIIIYYNNTQWEEALSLRYNYNSL
jgi:hypothetical protein